MQYRTPRRLAPLLALALLGAVGFASPRAFAVDRVWNNPAGGDFNTAENWTPNGVPTNADTAIINTNGTYIVTLSKNVALAGLTVGGTSGAASLSLANHNIQLSGPTLITSTGKLSLSGGDISGSGTIIVAGTLAADSGSLIGTGGITVNSGAEFDLLGDTTLDGRPFTNFGRIVAQTEGATLSAKNGVVLNNESGGLIDVTTSNFAVFTGYGGSGARLTLNNKVGGIIRKSVGADTCEFRDVNLMNAGRVEVQTGLLNLRDYGGGALNSRGC